MKFLTKEERAKYDELYQKMSELADEMKALIAPTPEEIGISAENYSEAYKRDDLIEMLTDSNWITPAADVQEWRDSQQEEVFGIFEKLGGVLKDEANPPLAAAEIILAADDDGDLAGYSPRELATFIEAWRNK